MLPLALPLHDGCVDATVSWCIARNVSIVSQAMIFDTTLMSLGMAVVPCLSNGHAIELRSPPTMTQLPLRTSSMIVLATAFPTNTSRSFTAAVIALVVQPDGPYVAIPVTTAQGRSNVTDAPLPSASSLTLACLMSDFHAIAAAPPLRDDDETCNV